MRIAHKPHYEAALADKLPHHEAARELADVLELIRLHASAALEALRIYHVER